MRFRVLFMLASLAVGFNACGGEDDEALHTGPHVDSASPQVSTSVEALHSQQADVAEIFGEVDSGCTIGNSSPWCGYFSSANKTFASYAVTKNSQGCTGAFIGPNLFLSAAHCGASVATPNVITYLGTSRTRPGQGATTRSEWGTGSCSFLLGSTQQDSSVLYRGAVDINLYYCSNVIDTHGRSVPPGMLMGMLDFDVRNVALNEQVWRLWWNQVFVAPYSQANHLLISRGTQAGGVPATSIQNQSDPYGYQNMLFYTDNTCTNQGASGSPSLSENWLRILGGPQSEGNGGTGDVPCGTVSSGAPAHSIFEDFYLDPRWASFQMNTSQVLSLGLQPTRYWGYQDRDHNSVLDIQEDLEGVGEQDRPYFFYNWDSRRQNALWKALGATNPFADQVTPPGPPYGIIHLESGTNSHDNVQVYAETLWRNDTFPFQPNSNYRVQLRTFVNSASSGSALQIRFGSFAPYSIPTTPGIARLNFLVSTDGRVCNMNSSPENCGIRIEAVNPSNSPTIPLISAELYTLSVTKEDVNRDFLMDFDDADKRGGWRNQNTGSRALILPDGIAAATNSVADFALAVTDDPARGAATDWTALNEHLDFITGQSFTVFFRARTSYAGTLKLQARAVTGSGVVLAWLSSMTISSAWSSEIMLGPFTAQTDTRLLFGASDFSAGANEHILIDNIRIHRN